MKNKFYSQLITISLVLFSLLGATKAKAQTVDSTTFDYDLEWGCKACGDSTKIASYTNDSLLDATGISKYIGYIQVKLKFFSCYTGPIYLYLNGNKVSEGSVGSMCSCNSCDSITFTISTLDIYKYYKYKQKNYFMIQTLDNSNIYMDRTIIKRFFYNRFNYDAGVFSIDSPYVRVCAGSKNIKVKVVNHGKKPLSSLSVDWKWNGVAQSSASISGTLDTFSTQVVTLGSKTFTKSKKDTLKVWTKNPGGIADSLNFNDTLSYVFYGSYSDTITVGGTSPMFSTVQAAVNALMEYGVCGPTWIKIRPGTYSEQVTIGTIPGTSATNTVTFLSSTLDSSSVVISYSANSSYNYTVNLNNVDYLKFYKITIRSLNTSYSRVVYFSGSVGNISFENCYINSVIVSSSSSSRSAVYRSYNSYTEYTKNISFLNTLINGGSYGIYMYNSYMNVMNGFYVRNCIFQNPYYGNIYCYYAKNIDIRNNQLNKSASSHPYAGYGMYLAYINDSMNIRENKIYHTNIYYSIYIYNAIGTSTKRLLIANNFISDNNTDNNGASIYLDYCSYVDIVHNNILTNYDYEPTYCLYTEDGSNLRILNNSMQNIGEGSVFNIYSSTSNSIAKSNNNNFYNDGNDLGSWYSDVIGDISDLKSKGFDSSSVSSDPNYTSESDLHVYSVDLESNAKPFNGITKDIDGETRNTTTPDIGADEFKLKTLDAGIVDRIRVTPGTKCMKVVLRNFGSNTLTSAKIDWKLNGVSKTQVNWSGSLAKGDTDIVCLGNVTFVADSLFTVKAWTSAPNSGTDSLNSNDTLNIGFYTSLNGEYTIGGTSPDFPTFGDALDALHQGGVVDSALFKVRNGTYTEQLSFMDIEGATHANSVIFQSENKDSTLVTLEWGSNGYSNNYTVSLDGTDGVSFRKMKIQNYSTGSYKRVINVFGAAKWFRLENNIITNLDSSSSSSYYVLLNMEDNFGNNTYISQNVFNRGSYAIYIYGDYSANEKNVTIKNNIFKNQGYMGLYLSNIYNLIISGNSMNETQPNLNYGIYVNSINGTNYVNNNIVNINNTSAYYGIYLSYSSYSTGDSLHIYNNMISITSNTNSSRGLYANDLGNANIYYNSVLNSCTDSSGNSSAFYFDGGYLKVYNNNFVHLKNGFAIYCDWVNYLKSNYNNIYSNGSKYVYWNGTQYSNLNNYKTSTSYDTSSVSVNPIYKSITDLHVSSVGVNAKAKVIGNLNKDIDGETRNSSTPDIGADEFTPPTRDVGVTMYLSPGETFKADTTNFELIITNFGLDTIKKVTVKVQINNDTLPRKIFNRTFASGDTIHVKMGKYYLHKDSVYNFAAWTSLPNSLSDQKPSNDTLKALNVRPALSGIYTIGGTSPDYATFKAAVNALTLRGVKDSVRFRVRMGTYTEQLRIPQIKGANKRNSIVFESQDKDTTKVTLTYGSSYSDTNYVVFLDGADGVTFRYMTIISTSSSNYNRIFSLKNVAENNTIYKNVLEAPNTSYYTDNNALIYSQTSPDNYLLISENHFKNGDYGIFMNGSGGSSYEKGLEISGNVFLNQYNHGIYLSYADTVNIKNNYFYADKYYGYYGMYLDNLRTNIKIQSNIMDLRNGYYGMYLYNCGTYFKRCLIANNAIYAKNYSTTSLGFRLYYCYYFDIIHNNINIDCYSTSSMCVYSYNGNYNTFYNNILKSNSGYCLYVNTSSAYTNLNYNNYYTGGTYIGYWNGSNATNISSWKTISSKDTNSVSVDPMYYSASNLHIKQISINGAAKYFSIVPLDFDGQTRNTSTPDIGADEFDPPSNDAGIADLIVPKKPFPADSQWVKVVLKNYGINAITSVSINWKFNGTSQTTKSWTGTLNSGDTVHVKLLKKYFASGTPYSTKVWTTNPNSTTDPENTNDTIEALNQYPAMRGVYTIGGSSPDFATFTDAVNAMKVGGIIDSVRFDVRNGTYNEQIRIPSIAGATNENSIIFQSEAVDSNKVIMTYSSPSYSNNWIVRIDSAKGVTFRHMRFNSGSTTYGRMFLIMGDAKNIRIHNCLLKGAYVASTSDYISSIYITYDNYSYPSYDNIKIYKNIFLYNAYGLYAVGSSDLSRGKNLNVYENVFENQYYMGVYVYYGRNPIIHKNKIYHTNSFTAYSSGYGVRLYYLTEGYQLTSNHIYNQEYYGVYIYNCNGAVNDTSLIANNFIHSRSNSSSYSFYMYNSYYLNFYYNNINSSSTNTSSTAAYFEYQNYTNINNNNFVHSGNGYALSIYNGTINKCDYNNFYNNSTNFFKRTSTTYNTLADWRTGTGYDLNSLNVNPDYKSSTDLHTEKVDLNGKARNVKYLVKYDFDDQKRDSVTPDIGADEYIPAANDASVAELKSPGSNFAATTYDIIAVVKNLGTDTIKKVTVKGKINNDTFTRKLVIKSFKTGDTIHVKLGQFTFHKDSIYNIKVWSFSPNGIADENTTNDTLKILNKRTALSGVYTIGGASPDFTNFKAAVFAMVSRSIIDSVRFRVRSGTYNEHIEIPNIVGSQKRNAIIFESENKDTSSVTLQYSATTSDSNYVVKLNGADGVTFRYLILKSLSSSNYTRVFDLRNSSNYNTIYKNIIQGKNTNWGSTENALIFSGSDVDNNLHIKDNHIKDGDFAIYLYGYPSTSPYYNEKGHEITGNKILNPFYYGIYLNYQDTLNLSSNYIYMDKYSYSYAIYLESVKTNYKIHRNILNLKLAQAGIYAYSCGTSFMTNLISNNAIYVKNTSTNDYGIYLYSTGYTNLIHNSVNLECNYTSNYALYSYSGGNNKYYNNNFVSSSGGYAMYVYSTSPLTSNYNNLYTNGVNLGYWNGTNITNLSTWKSTSGKDANSISVNPLYKAVNNLHVKEMSLNGAAQYFSSVPLDFDYETRDTLTPDIGADEFQLPSNDAGISHIIIPQKPFAKDSQFVKIAMKNFGGNKLYQVNIGWTFNGVAQTPITWNDSLESGDTIHVKLAKKYFAPYTNYSIKAWTYLPNGTGDSINTNDTLKVLNQQPALSGIYTIGGASPDFATFTDAVNAMKAGGILDSVRFDVRAGTYYEKINIPYILGANSENDIIFQSELKDSSKVFLVGTPTYSDNYTVKLDSTNGVTFRFMTLQTTIPTYYNRVFYIDRTCKNINIHDCHLIGKSNSNTDNGEAVIFFYNDNTSLYGSFDGVKIYNNNIHYGSFGIYCYGYSNISIGNNLKIYNNNLINNYYMSIYIYYNRNLYIHNNNINKNNSGYGNDYGIYTYYLNEGFTITNNKITDVNYMGLYQYNCLGASGDTALIANNFINVGTNNSVYGAYIQYPGFLNFFNNNINLTSSNTSSCAGYFYEPSNTSVCNNIFSTSGAGYSLYSYYGSFIRSNFNNFYTLGSNLLSRNSTDYSSLSTYYTATGYEQKSLNVDPDYVSNSDLHVRGSDLDGKGRNHKYLISKDIDGQTRNTTKPDIGADEFDIPAANDGGILSYISPLAPFVAGSTPVKVVIKNYGSDSLKSATIKWRVNGTLQTNKSWTGKLKTGQTDTVNIGNYTFVSGKEHDMKFWTTDPNGVADTTNYNDTLVKDDVYPALDGVYTVSGTLPDFTDLNAVVKAIKLGGVIDSVWFKIRPGTYNYNITLEQYSGAHPNRPIYFESSTGDSSDVNIENHSSAPAFNINGADYIKFRKLTFTNFYSNLITIQNVSKGISFENCYFNLSNSYYYYTSIGIYSGSSADDSTIVKNCRFEEGNYGIYLYGYPASGSVLEKHHKISNNIFNNQKSTAIYLTQINAFEIKNNTISSNTSSSSSSIYINSSQNKINISYNKINRLSSDYSAGLSINDHSGNSSNRAEIYNNFISTGGSAFSKTVYLNYVSYINFYHNSLNQYGSASGLNSIALNINSGSNFDIRNNVISNPGSGYALLYDGSPSSIVSDYNDIYTSGTYIGRIASSDYTNLAAWKAASTKETNSISYNPNYVSNTDLHSNLAALDSACLYISSVTDDIDNESRNTSYPDMGADEFQSLASNIGVVSVLKPETTCNLDSSIVKLRLFNFGNQSQVNFPVKYKLSSSSSVVSATITDTLKPGQFIEYQFSAKEKVLLNTTLSIKAWTDLSTEMYRNNDSTAFSFVNYSKPDSVKFMSPSNYSKNIDYPIALSWLPSTGATKYDLYVWDSTISRPSTPLLSNTTQISYQINNGLSYGITYYWQLVAKNPVCTTEGKIQSFTMRYLPDLVVNEVTGPHSAFSGTAITVSWKIQNNGLGATTGSWYDVLYLSTDAVWDVTDVYMGATLNPMALNPSQSYNSSLSINIPNGTSGNYYLFVFSDKYLQLSETDNNNNNGRDTGKIKITLTPPPDLQVMSVSRPSIVFSGSTANTTYVVKNKGTGDTRSGTWVDRIYLSTEKDVNGSSYNLGSYTRSGNLKVDSSYTITRSVTIPNYISGKYFFVIYTDNYNNEYEYVYETNNSKGSDTIKVLLTPPPDLIVKNLQIKDTASNSEWVEIKYDVINDGGTSTNYYFYDNIYLCPTSTFNSGISQWIGQVYHSPLDSKDTSSLDFYVKMPQNINGKYYAFVVTDVYNSVNEISGESNNTSTPDTMIILSPDLKVTKVTVNSVDSTGSSTPINWTVKNDGWGNDYQGLRYDSIFISSYSVWNRANAKALGRHGYSNTLLKGDSISRNTTVTIPDGFNGDKFFYVYTDATNTIYEWSKENNNVNRSDTMDVILSPYPDLLPTVLDFPDSAEAGQMVSLNYKVKNQGTNVANPNWKDKFYLSKDSIFDPTKVLELTNVTKSSILKVDSSYTSAVYFTIPTSVALGNYYYWVFTDAALNVYEHFNDSNNKARSGKAFIDGYPPVDLRVNCPTVLYDTLNSGYYYNLAYSVTNIGDAKTQISSWNDAVYLSTDSIFNNGDINLKTIQANKALSKDSSYSINTTVLIPNGISGDYYLIVKTDINKAITDIDTNNNKKTVCKTSGWAKKFRINLTPPADLKFISWNIPSTATSGQNMKVKFKVENNGSGSTRSGSWIDQVYLSTDYTIDGLDFKFGEKRHNTNLSVGNWYLDSIESTIPIDKTGNFIIIVRTDGANEEYEHTNEGNNVVSGITTISKAPPADLIVSFVSSPDSVISGKTISATYKVKNIGSNPMSGWLRDNIYLSKDTKQDASDVLLNTEYYGLTLGPGSENTINKTLTVSGVSLGDYYVLASTDVMNNINEITDTNNTTAASNLLNVTVPILPIGVKTKDSLPDNDEIYYRIIVPDSLDGETMLITLKADSVSGNNEMYLRFGDVASKSAFDFKHGAPFKGNQEIIVPELKKGTYYLMVTGSTSAGTYQKISLYPRILPFEIRKVTKSSGGNTGEITVLIEGSKFTEETYFMLVDTLIGGGSVMPGAEDMYKYSVSSPLFSNYIDPTKIYVTFDLKGMKKTVYDVSAFKDLEETTLNNGFKVEAGSSENLAVSMQRPGNTRANMVLYWDVVFGNSGNTDIVNKKIKVVSSGGAPIGFTPSDLTKNETELEIIVQGNEGPPNRLAPGGYGSVRVYTKSSAALGITIVK